MVGLINFKYDVFIMYEKLEGYKYVVEIIVLRNKLLGESFVEKIFYLLNKVIVLKLEKFFWNVYVVVKKFRFIIDYVWLCEFDE